MVNIATDITCSTPTQCTMYLCDSWPQHHHDNSLLISSRILYRGGTCTSKIISMLTLCCSINIPNTPMPSLMVWTPPPPPPPQNFQWPSQWGTDIFWKHKMHVLTSSWWSLDIQICRSVSCHNLSTVSSLPRQLSDQWNCTWWYKGSSWWLGLFFPFHDPSDQFCEQNTLVSTTH